MLYVIKPTPDTPNSQGDSFPSADIRAAVCERSGRDSALIARLLGSLTRKRRVYVARDRRVGRGGFIVERVTA